MAADVPTEAAVSRFAERVKAALPETFQVAVQPRIGDYYPDLLITGPDGDELVVEVKFGSGLLHIADLAQVAAYREALMGLPGGTRSPRAVLVTTRQGSDAITDAASRLDIAVVGADRSEAQLADKLAAVMLTGRVVATSAVAGQVEVENTKESG